jgi:hypothetical protein
LAAFQPPSLWFPAFESIEKRIANNEQENRAMMKNALGNSIFFVRRSAVKHPVLLLKITSASA